jgi:hypothetical protein
VSSIPQAVVLPYKPGPYQVATAPRKMVSGSSGETAALDASPRTTARSWNCPVSRARQRATNVPSVLTVVRACFVHTEVAGSRDWTTTLRPARRSSTAPRKRTLRPSSALPPPERANGEGGAACGAVAPPDSGAGSCAPAVAGMTAANAATTIASVSEPLINFLRCLRGELTGSRRESSATAGNPADSPPRISLRSTMGPPFAGLGNPTIRRRAG